MCTCVALWVRNLADPCMVIEGRMSGVGGASWEGGEEGERWERRRETRRGRGREGGRGDGIEGGRQGAAMELMVA